ncbi:hypothetical protein [uncultured Enterovirga sp.]|uniref:hypothetical protein n=1 Tax=uncultured Enterovirga sp. TaxID=2026352 RepID=UPI0035CA2B34
MRTMLLAFAAAAAIGAATGAAEARPLRTVVYAAPLPAGLSADEILDYRMEQLERRQEMERERLQFSQRVQRRALDADED